MHLRFQIYWRQLAGFTQSETNLKHSIYTLDAILIDITLLKEHHLLKMGPLDWSLNISKART